MDELAWGDYRVYVWSDKFMFLEENSMREALSLNRVLKLLDLQEN